VLVVIHWRKASDVKTGATRNARVTANTHTPKAASTIPPNPFMAISLILLLDGVGRIVAPSDPLKLPAPAYSFEEG
jgi:hypothetical protein